MGLVAQRADVDELADRVGRAELGDDVTGRGGVDHHEVEVGPALDRLAYLPHDLADREDLLDPGRGGRDEVEHTRERPDASDHGHPQVQAQVLLQRRLGVHRHREDTRVHLAAA